jgi:hypothetical protein
MCSKIMIFFVIVCFDVMYSGEYNGFFGTKYPKGRGFDSHLGQANFSACLVWIYHTLRVTFQIIIHFILIIIDYYSL